MEIRIAQDSELDEVLAVETEAFGNEKEAELVRDLLKDPTAAPALSLLAWSREGRPIGHVLFTRAVLEGHPELDVRLLAPLAVVPSHQGQDVGGALTREGLRMAREQGAALAFVLGHPSYYPRHGFRAPAGPMGFAAPYPIPDKDAEAWMVQELRPGLIGSVAGRVRPADALLQPEHWRE